MTTVRKPLSSQSPSSPEFRSMKTVSFAMLKAEKAGLWQTPQTLCQEDSWLLMLLRLPGILSLPGIMLPVPVQGKNEQSIEQILPFWRNITTCPSSMSCQSCQLMWHSCSNPVHIDHKGPMQVLTSDQFALQRVRSMKRVSFAM